MMVASTAPSATHSSTASAWVAVPVETKKQVLVPERVKDESEQE